MTQMTEQGLLAADDTDDTDTEDTDTDDTDD